MSKNKKILIGGLCLPKDKGKPHNHLNNFEVFELRAKLIRDNIKTSHSYDHVIFYDTPFPEDIKEDINKILPTKFVSIWDNPSPRLSDFCERNNCTDGTIGYKGMCLFYAMEVFHYIKDYDYFMRLDDDSLVCTELELDSFIEKDYTYGWAIEKQDFHKETWDTLPAAIRSYVTDNNIPIKCPLNKTKRGGICMWTWYNNFMFTKVDFWLSKEVKDFQNFIWEQRGIENYRWGDNPIMANALRMFCDENLIHKMKFAYFHASHKKGNFNINDNEFALDFTIKGKAEVIYKNEI